MLPGRRPAPGRYHPAAMVVTILGVVQVLICVVLIFLVLMHSGKDSGLSGAFGVGTGAGPLGGGSLVERNLNRWTSGSQSRSRSTRSSSSRSVSRAPRGRRWLSSPVGDSGRPRVRARRRTPRAALPARGRAGEDLDRLGSQPAVDRLVVGVRELAGAVVELASRISRYLASRAASSSATSSKPTPPASDAGAVSASSGSTGPVSRAIRARRIGMPTITTTAARIASTITNCSTS